MLAYEYGLLVERLGPRRSEKLLRVCRHGPAFAAVDNRLMSLALVEKGFTDAAIFTAEGEVLQPADVLYKRPILVERGRFRPVTWLTLDLLESALRQFAAEPDLAGEEPVVLMEMTLHGLRSEKGVEKQEFLARADSLRSLGRAVLISNHGPYYQLAEHLSRYTQCYRGPGSPGHSPAPGPRPPRSPVRPRAPAGYS